MTRNSTFQAATVLAYILALTACSQGQATSAPSLAPSTPGSSAACLAANLHIGRAVGTLRDYEARTITPGEAADKLGVEAEKLKVGASGGDGKEGDKIAAVATSLGQLHVAIATGSMSDAATSFKRLTADTKDLQTVCPAS